MDRSAERHPNRRRIAAWAVAALVVLAPLAAMQVTDQVNWTRNDFVFAALLVGSFGVAFELAVRGREDRAYRSAAGLALVTGFLTIWINAAVGIIGDPADPANRLFAGVLAVAIVGSMAARFRPRGMAVAMAATALAEAVVSAFALADSIGPFVLSLTFAGMWLASAWLFRKAAKRTDFAG